MINKLEEIKSLFYDAFKFTFEEIEDEQYIIIDSIEFDYIDDDDPVCNVSLRYKLSNSDENELEVPIFLDQTFEFNKGFIANKFWELM